MINFIELDHALNFSKVKEIVSSLVLHTHPSKTFVSSSNLASAISLVIKSKVQSC